MILRDVIDKLTKDHPELEAEKNLLIYLSRTLGHIHAEPNIPTGLRGEVRRYMLNDFHPSPLEQNQEAQEERINELKTVIRHHDGCPSCDCHCSTGDTDY